MAKPYVNKDEMLIRLLRQCAISGASVSELVLYVINYFDFEPEPEGSTHLMPVMLYFRDAFCLTVKESREMGYWRGFRGGTLSDEWLDEEIMPHIQRKATLWRDHSVAL